MKQDLTARRPTGKLPKQAPRTQLCWLLCYHGPRLALQEQNSLVPLMIAFMPPCSLACTFLSTQLLFLSPPTSQKAFGPGENRAVVPISLLWRWDLSHLRLLPHDLEDVTSSCLSGKPCCMRFHKASGFRALSLCQLGTWAHFLHSLGNYCLAVELLLIILWFLQLCELASYQFWAEIGEWLSFRSLRQGVICEVGNTRGRAKELCPKGILSCF